VALGPPNVNLGTRPLKGGGPRVPDASVAAMRKMALWVAALAAMPASLFGLRAELQPPSAPAFTPATVVSAAYASTPAGTDRGPRTAPPASDLPTIAVPPLPVHAAPSDAETKPAQPYTIVPMDRAIAARSLPQPHRARQAARPAVAKLMRLSGRARAADGVTLDLAGRAVRLFGIRLAPGYARAAHAVLAEQIGRGAVTCEAPRGQEAPSRFVCHNAAGVDIGRRLVSQGLVLADRRSSFQYAADEDRARKQHAGYWR
jgi:endonuclease YncB( thermonuclease family)